MTDFSMISACGECCTGCRKRQETENRPRAVSFETDAKM